DAHPAIVARPGARVPGLDRGNADRQLHHLHPGTDPRRAILTQRGVGRGPGLATGVGGLMQLLTAPPRTGFTAAQVRTVLQNSASISYDYGLDLLIANGGAQQNATLQPLVAADLSGNVLKAEQNLVARDNYATVHGTCSLTLDTDLQWGYDMVRPYMVLSSPAEPGVPAVTGVRFNLGCYVVTSPQ